MPVSDSQLGTGMVILTAAIVGIDRLPGGFVSSDLALRLRVLSGICYLFLVLCI